MQVLRTRCAKTSAGQELSYGVDVPAVQLAGHAESSTLYGQSYGYTSKFSQLDALILNSPREALVQCLTVRSQYTTLKLDAWVCALYRHLTVSPGAH